MLFLHKMSNFMDFDLPYILCLFIDYFIRVIIGYVVLSLLLKKGKWSTKNIFYSWLAFTLLIIINYVFYSLEEFFLYKISFLTFSAVFTYLIRYYYLKLSRK